jgi:hypothetical protein
VSVRATESVSGVLRLAHQPAQDQDRPRLGRRTGRRPQGRGGARAAGHHQRQLQRGAARRQRPGPSPGQPRRQVRRADREGRERAVLHVLPEQRDEAVPQLNRARLYTHFFCLNVIVFVII